MMLKIKNINVLIVSIFIILTSTISSFANESSAYKLSNGRISVREDVFNQLVQNDKLVDQYKKEIEYYKESINEIKKLNLQKDDIQNQRITILKDTIELKNQIVVYKDDNIKNWEKLYNLEKDENKKLKVKNWFTKFLITGLTAYAVSEIDSNSGKVAVGALGTAIVLGY